MDDPQLQQRLAAETRFTRLVHLSSCASTQDVAAEEPAGDVCVWADLQEAGRGRKGRSWSGSPGKDVEVTFRASLDAVDRPLRLAPVLATAVVVALESFAGTGLSLDSPNDVVHNGRKLCGILVDAAGSRDVDLLIGIGVNVNRTGFPPELLERATSLGLISGRIHDRATVVLRLGQSIDAALRAFEEGRLDDYVPFFRARLGLCGRRVRITTVTGSTHEGVLEDIDLEQLLLGGARFPLAAIEALERI